ncbi:hypothetical protein L6R52_21225 [Myxococcota bacterium]|nr:hypothetical protein [Myxococcota bacterium]
MPQHTGKIERIELHHIEIPLPSPLFPVWIPGYPQYRQVHTLLAVTTRDGLTGYATGVAFDRERDSLGDFIGRFLVGIDPYDVHAAAERLRQSAFLGWRNTWMEMAFWDLAAKARQIPLHQLITDEVGAAPIDAAPTAVEVYASFLEHRAPKVRAESVERCVRMGFRGAKLNTCSETEDEDREKLVTARKLAGKDFKLYAHARQAWNVSLVDQLPKWTLDRAVRFAEVAKEHGVAWIQEPLPSESWDELTAFARRSPVPIAGGDIALNILPLRALIEAGIYSVVTPDAAFAGLSNVVQTMKACRAKGIGFAPASNSDGLGLAANAHALVAWSRLAPDRTDKVLEFPWEPPALIPAHRDALLTEPLEIRADGLLPVPAGHGVGVEIDQKTLRRYGRKFYTLTPVRFVASAARRSGLRQSAELSIQKQRRKRSRNGSAGRVPTRT